jgi:NAD-dependent deacetylase
MPPAGCAELIRASQRLVALTGAGISTAAGVPDFRGPQGLYVTGAYDPQATFEIAGFLHDPAPFYAFTRDVLGLVEDLQPTFTHRLLASLERDGRLRSVITQNVDPLHQRAGSRNVIAIHGGYWTSHCLHCRDRVSLDDLLRLLDRMEVPRCGCGGVIKPDVVLFGEPVYAMDEAIAAVAEADLLLVLGSSLTVYPAAWLPESASCPIVVVNSGPVELSPARDRYVVDAELDPYFREVARELGIESNAEA